MVGWCSMGTFNDPCFSQHFSQYPQALGQRASPESGVLDTGRKVRPSARLRPWDRSWQKHGMPLKNRGFLGGDSDKLREIYDYDIWWFWSWYDHDYEYYYYDNISEDYDVWILW